MFTSKMMYQSLLFLTALVITSTRANHDEGLPTISPVVIPPSADGEGVCPSNEARTAARQNLTEGVRTLLRSLLATKEVPECGEGQWLPVASLNMTDPSQHCPGDWKEYTTPIRGCARQESLVNTGTCDSAFFRTNGYAYSSVCGRVTGETSTTPDGFFRGWSADPGPAYVDGVSVTYGQRRRHIWSFAVGYASSCPCSDVSGNDNPVPDFVGDNYFCDRIRSENGQLWDGQDCSNNNDCCTFHSPPWFKVRLPTTTTEEIEMRICGDQNTNDEYVPIEYVELYVQ